MNPLSNEAFAKLAAILLLLAAAPAAAAAAKQSTEPSGDEDTPTRERGNQPWFLFDRPDQTLAGTLLESPLAYDAGIASAKDGLWLAWLEFEPGKGDHLWIGQRGKEGWRSRQQLTRTPGDYANPTPTLDAAGQLWLSYEASDAQGNWQVYARQGQRTGDFGAPVQVSLGAGPNLSHRATPDPTNGLWLVWQSDAGGRFGILHAHVTPAGASVAKPIGTSAANRWAPSAVVTPDAALHIVWDAYTSHNGYSVFAESLPGAMPPQAARTEGGRSAAKPVGNLLAVADSPAFEAHAQIASGNNGKLWVLWEEDGENWGQRYVARKPGDKNSTKMSDRIGPLHRFRRLHLAELNETTELLTEHDIPQPSFDLARHRTNAPPELRDFGAFYEAAQLVVDGHARPWIVYRHFYAPWLGMVPAHHKQENMRLYARCLLGEGWSQLYAFEDGHGDGLQRISVAPQDTGIALAWTTGRTDRRKGKQAHGVEFAEIQLPADARSQLADNARTRALRRGQILPEPRQRPAAQLAGKRYELFYGDLHRHTDISLCFSPVDGTIDDAYRYAIDAAPLDFLGITDHTHDLEMGQPLAHIWWRSRKEVNRHELPGCFIPFYAYERSRGDTDHNVISLRDDMLRPHTYPLPQFWKELDTNTFTIPHQPFNPVLWKNEDNVHRPLLEIYQGMRNDIKEADAQQGLAGGHRFGIIASSDHLSTNASFACVWAERPTRESIFRAMQARRTFGATAKIILKVTAGDHWMGESFSAAAMPPIQIEAEGTAPIEKVEIVMDGQTKETLPGKAAGAAQKFLYVPDSSLTGSHIFFVRLQQTDGNHAWSSPLWVALSP